MERPAHASLTRRQEPGSLVDTVYDALITGLRNGHYKPGDRLREDELAQSLGVSRTPVREAFGRLITKRLIEPGGGRGLVVRRLSNPEILELYALREILEGTAARLAAQHASSAEIDMMQDALARFDALGDDHQEIARVNRVFHERVLDAARNRFLNAALGELQESIALLGPTTYFVPGRHEAAKTEHRLILEAIAAHQPQAAEHHARAHIQQALRARLI
jgi:DNA-binding GntR family transcriptional regulator